MALGIIGDLFDIHRDGTLDTLEHAPQYIILDAYDDDDDTDYDDPDFEDSEFDDEDDFED